NLRHDRPGPELELLGLLVVDRDARHVTRQEVRGELDATEGAPDGLRERLRQHRLSDAGHVLNENVALARQRYQRKLDFVALTDQHAGYVAQQRAEHLVSVSHPHLPRA